MKHRLLLTLTAALAIGTGVMRAELVTFYVGQDGLATLASGTYRGLPNPNAGRLTFLYAHQYFGVTERVGQPPITLFNNHYHSIGIYTYTGDTNAPVTLPTNANSRIPEASTGQPPLTLVAATNGLHTDKLVNRKTAENYSDPRIRSVHDILPHVTATATNQFGYGSAEYVMFYSSGGRWTNALDGVVVAMELVEKSPELRVGTTDALEALVNPGDRVTLGNGNSFEFAPVVWAEPDTAPGTYELKFKLVDVSGGPSPMLESGIVTFLYRVPETPQLELAATVTLSLPLITEGYVLEQAESVDGPWTAVTSLLTTETLTGGHAAAQTGNKVLTEPVSSPAKYYRLRKL